MPHVEQATVEWETPNEHVPLVSSRGPDSKDGRQEGEVYVRLPGEGIKYYTNQVNKQG